MIYIIAKIVVFVTIFMIVFTTTSSIISLFVESVELRDSVLKYLQSQGSLSMFGYFGLEESSDYTTVVIVGTSFHFVMNFVIMLYALVFTRILKKVSKGEQSFTKQNAKKLFIMSIVALLFLAMNPILSLALFLVGIFISNLFKYVTYLNEKSQQTQHIQESMIISMAEVVENKSD